jgi:hypothetical protein
MCSHKTSKLLLCGARAIHDKSQGNESKREVLRREGEDVDGYVCVWVVLGEGVCKSEDEWLKENITADKGAAQSLLEDLVSLQYPTFVKESAAEKKKVTGENMDVGSLLR